MEPNRVLAGDFETGFRLGYMVKDLRHAFDLAAELGFESPLGRGRRHRRAHGGGGRRRRVRAACPSRRLSVAAAVDGGQAASGPRRVSPRLGARSSGRGCVPPSPPAACGTPATPRR
ncbi:NAD-binding protein [Streptomyces anulatus]|uniref:NAD-binding protein n=1 Tax=Streptomyces anulatus TaxID=1892 RepID=UPI0033226367